MKTRLEQLYQTLVEITKGNQKKVQVTSCLSVYFGISTDGYIRLSFMSSIPAPKLDSTKLLKITQGQEEQDVYWTSFDLLQEDAKVVFFTFCEDMIRSITDIKEEMVALTSIKKRYLTWKAMFINVKNSQISREVLQGLYGELYFLKNYMLEKYDTQTAISSWSGPNSTSKDFSLSDNWYEIKTIGNNVQDIHISSLTQLSSPIDGRLVVIKLEEMSDEFNNNNSNISMLLTQILEQLNDERIEELFLSKISNFDLQDEYICKNYDVKSINIYIVNDNFPRLTEKDIIYPEIGEIRYTLLVNSLEKYKEQS